MTDTKTRLLEAAWSLLRRQPAPSPLSHIKAAQVAREAGLTTGALYQKWPGGMREFHSEVLDYGLSRDRYLIEDRIERHIRELWAAGETFNEVIRFFCGEERQELERNDSFHVQMALWAQHGTEPVVSERLRRQYHEIEQRRIGLYADLLEAQGLEPRSPFTLETIAVTLTALVEGLGIRGAIDPEAVRMDARVTDTPAEQASDDDEPTWDLFGCIVLALLPAMTTPREKNASGDHPDHDDLWSFVSRIRDPHWHYPPPERGEGETAEGDGAVADSVAPTTGGSPQ